MALDFSKIPKAVGGKLAKLGIRQPFDLVLHLPLRYEDETHLYPIVDAPMGSPVLVEGTVRHAEVTFRPRRQLVVRIEDGGGELFVRLLNFYPSQQQQLAEGKRVRLLGEIRRGFFGDEMVHPKIRVVSEGAALAEALTPVYPTVNGLAQPVLRKLIDQALRDCPLTDTLPPALLRDLGLMSFDAAVRLLHHPTPDVTQYDLSERNHAAWLRLKFDELLAQQLSMRLAYRRRREQTAPVIHPEGTLANTLAAQLPFGLTGAQQRVVSEIRSDLASPHPMQRLLQGDVGAGKTVVAALAALDAIEAGYQVALMAPTEILAEQHFKKLADWLAPMGIQVSWLAGSLKPKQKAEAIARVESGEARLAIGTHALFQDAVSFPELGLAIVDEQHRFGVHQRLALRQKAAGPLSRARERAGGEGASYHQRPPVPVPDDLLAFARTLRTEATDAENLLWQLLRNRRLAHAKFRRQHPIDRYIADFYCEERRLVIELDGGQHQAQQAYDEERTRFMEKRGLRVLRFWNNQTLSETEVVLGAIWQALHDDEPPSPPAPLPRAGEGSDMRTEPHMLMMSATPIPRTLAMSFYADLDVSIIDELPPGRTPIKTKLVSDARREEMIEYVRHVCAEGRQAYWVCPLIEESEALELQTAIDTHAMLSEALPELKVGLVHGRLKPAEKAAIMAAFSANETQVLVATTVIEVGVDVPNATLMVIEHAERMGLAQLHQLRGRVGRGAHESRCILLFAAPLGEVAKQRLKVIYETTDGFAIAREDLRIRGPGEFLGARQSGVPMLRFADLERDAELLERARDVAAQLIDQAPDVAETHLARWLAGREALLKT